MCQADVFVLGIDRIGLEDSVRIHHAVPNQCSATSDPVAGPDEGNGTGNESAL